MSKVFVVDANRKPLNLVHPGHARLLLTQKKAAVLRRYPFTIVLKTAVEHPEVPPLRLKIDPGSQTTGLALLNETTGEVVFAAEIQHREQAITNALGKRRAVRRARCQRKTRYRKPRFANRKRKLGWLPPSVESRMANSLTWVQRLRKFAPITALSQELVTFDFQQMENPEISGVEYQQGTLAGYEVRHYLLEKWDRACTYCGIKHVPLQVEHIQAKANGGTDRVSNLCLACEKGNSAKGKQDIRVFLAQQPELLARILAQARTQMKDATAVNMTRWAFYRRLNSFGLPVECGSGGLTKFNRTVRGLPKAHWIDAACVGKSTPEQVKVGVFFPCWSRRRGMDADRNAMSTRWVSLAHSPKGQRGSKAFRPAISSGRLSPLGKSKGCTSDVSWCVHLAPSISEPNRAGCKGSVIASALWFIDAMAIGMRKERAMRTPPPNRPHKEWPGFGEKYWSARSLAPLLGYNKWERFEVAIQRAITACEQVGQIVQYHFPASSKMVKIGSGAQRELKDYNLSRLACYLVAQNGDPRKPEIASAQVYFAVSTRAHEIHQLRMEQEKRLETRLKVSESFKQLAGAAQAAGVLSKKIGLFVDAGYIGLHHHTMEELRTIKNTPKNEEYLDNIGRPELSAIDFKNVQTEEKLRRDQITDEDKAIDTHYYVGDQVRKTLESLQAPMPETLPPVPSIRKMIEERRRASKKRRLKATKQGESSLFDVSPEQ